MHLTIELCPGLAIVATGTHSKGEPDVGLAESFELGSLELIGRQDLYEVIEWTEAQHGDAITKINELCIEQLKNN